MKPYAQLSVQNQSTVPAVGQVVDTARAFFHDFASPSMVAQSYAITVTTVLLGSVLTIGIDEVGESVTHTSLDDVEANAAAALALLWNANPLLRGYATASAVGAVLTLTANVTGYDVTFTVNNPAILVGVNTPSSMGTSFRAGRPIFFNAGIPSQTPPAGTDATNIIDRLVGITTRRYDEQTENDAPYEQKAPRRVEVMTSGRIGVFGGDSAVYRDPLYIGSGANAGLFFNAAGADRVLVPAHIGHWYARNEVMLRFGR